jgi:hypothetical protein
MTYRHASSTLVVVLYLVIGCYATETMDTTDVDLELGCMERCNHVVNSSSDRRKRSYCNLGCALGSDLEMVYTDPRPTTTPPV